MQKHFIVYDVATGAIKRHGKCPEEHVAAQARAAKGEAVREDTARTQSEASELMITHRVDSAGLARRPDAEIAARRPKQLTQVSGAAILSALKRKGLLSEKDLTP